MILSSIKLKASHFAENLILSEVEIFLRLITKIKNKKFAPLRIPTFINNYKTIKMN